eukprot:CCRYP_008216-RA/>CCRYP_008216-RA protein AED:0.49 eAED:0.45 QI:0/-1/0/1/-1/1/1/0/80
MRISRDVIPANSATTRKAKGLRKSRRNGGAVEEAAHAVPIPPPHKTCHAANPLVTGLIATNAAQLQFLIHVLGFKCTVYK